MEGGFFLPRKSAGIGITIHQFSHQNGIIPFTRAFLALLHHHRPEMVDLSKMEEEDTVTNCSKAFAIAEVGWDRCGINNTSIKCTCCIPCING